jgi:hypothetical protein
MADDIPQDPQLATTARLIAERRDKLLAERTELREAREALLARSRRVDREIGDCRAAARFFGLNLEFPEDPQDIAEREALVMRRLREQEMVARDAARAAQRSFFNETRHPPGAGRPAPLPPVPVPPLPAYPLPPPPIPSVSAPPVPPLPADTIYPPAVTLGPPPRPTVREVALVRLREAGGKGAKAADIREYFERTYGEVVHEKTVGMTLYRLLKARLVRRDGHTWFFGPSNAETKNPGGETPGLIETGN